MAFLRKEKKGDTIYLSICESYRDDDGKSQRRVLHNLGNVSKFTPDALQRIGKQLLLIANGDTIKTELVELSRSNYGFPLVIHSVLRKYGLDVLMRRLTKTNKLSFKLMEPLLLMLCDRLNDPMSKLGSYEIQQDYIGIESTKLHNIYRCLDYLASNNEQIQKQLYQSNRTLFNYELDVVFFDVTTFYFDSDEVKEGQLRQLGFGKDGKVGKTQVVFSLLIDKNKMPIGFELFNGKQFEGHTFENALRRLKQKYAIGKVIVVADSGMMSKKNIDYFRDESVANTYEYIVGERLKSLPEKIKKQLVNKVNYKTINIINEDGEATQLTLCTVDYDGKKIIGTWSEKRAKKDKAERENKLAKAKVLLSTPALLKKKAHHYYLKTTDQINYTSDQERIKESEQYDGFKAIATNTKEITDEQVIEHYTYLYQIEHSFRTFKSYLEIRPMYHWTDKRIEGHLVMCYIAFATLRYIQMNTKLSENTIRNILSKMQVSKVQCNQEIHWMTANMNEEAIQLIKNLKLKQLPASMTEFSIIKYLPKIV